MGARAIPTPIWAGSRRILLQQHRRDRTRLAGELVSSPPRRHRPSHARVRACGPGAAPAPGHHCRRGNRPRPSYCQLCAQRGPGCILPVRDRLLDLRRTHQLRRIAPQNRQPIARSNPAPDTIVSGEKPSVFIFRAFVCLTPEARSLTPEVLCNAAT
jgi:hypothetical protein